MEHNVHRAARVFTPRNVVIVNAADAELRRRLEEAGGAQRALDWVLGGLSTPDFTQLGPSRSSFIESMLAQNIPRETAEQMADAGGLEDEETPALSLPAPALRVAERQAAFVATGLYGSRVPVNEMLEGKDPDMRFRYERSLRRAGFESVDLVDRFPVLTGCYGFTRGDMGPGQSTIVPFMAPGTNEYAIYSERSETEALFVRLDPVMIVSWLASRGIDLPEPADARDARRIVLENATWPAAGSDPSGDGSVGELVTILVHSFAHRLLRRTAVIAGIERESLSEFLVPAHLGFFVYAAARGDFVLGGLQAMFENDLDVLVEDVVFADHRCPMDPGCDAGGAACACCLHVGEPSCRMYNQYLNRRVLESFLDMAGEELGQVPAGDAAAT